ncbi:aminopeptidase N-like [Haemaphysalis longicornis]
MSKTFHLRSTAACGLVVLMLLLCSVGLLIAFLKGHQQQTRDNLTTEGSPPSVGVNSLLPIFPRRRTTQPPSTTTTPKPVQTTTLEPIRPKLDFRLPAHVVPLAYDLSLEPHLDTDAFDGEVFITVNATRPVDRFVVHVFRLTVDQTEVFFEDGSPVTTGDPFEDDLNEFFVVPVGDKAGAGPTPAGIYRLRFKFRGSLVGGIVGFYKSSYKIGNETRRVLLPACCHEREESIASPTSPMRGRQQDRGPADGRKVGRKAAPVAASTYRRRGGSHSLGSSTPRADLIPSAIQRALHGRWNDARLARREDNELQVSEQTGDARRRLFCTAAERGADG